MPEEKEKKQQQPGQSGWDRNKDMPKQEDIRQRQRQEEQKKNIKNPTTGQEEQETDEDLEEEEGTDSGTKTGA